MEKKIKLYSIILALVYFSLVIYSFYQGLESFQAGFNMGRESAMDISKSSLEIHHFKVKPVDGAYTYPELITNTKTGEQIKAETREYAVLMNAPFSSHSTLSFIIKILQLLFSFVFIFIFFCIPVLFFKTIRSIIKGNILNKGNIRRISALSWLLIGYYLLNLLLYNMGETYITKQLLQLDNYEVVSDYSDMTALILGIVTLLFAEILKLSLRMKEEQDLTI